MKVVFVGGGALRLLGVLRSAMAVPGVLDDGEICLYDLDVTRAETMGRMLLKTPESARAGCRVRWDMTLPEALDGADAVGVVLMAGSRRSYTLGNAVSHQHGYLSSDNVSVNGGFLAVKGGSILMGLAQQMEQHCPEAWLLDFANPVAVFSAMVNNHTRIKALGVCAGYTNHQWDLSRLLGADEKNPDFDVDVAGVNHFSFILSGSLHGRDLFQMLDEALEGGYEPPPMQAWWPELARQSIPQGMRELARIYKELGVLIFSSEGDGMNHLRYDQALAESVAASTSSVERTEAGLEADRLRREDSDRRFRSYLDQELDAAFWRDHWREDLVFKCDEHDIFVRLLTGIAGVDTVKVVASRPVDGAINGVKARTVAEYSQLLYKREIRPAGSYDLPDVVHGLVSALATHQTMLADAVALDDPRLLAQALLTYPVRPYSMDLRELCRELLMLNEPEISPALRHAADYL